MAKFYLTTAIPYVNAKPHIGHTLEFVQADVIARYHKILGDETLLLSGGDENALKNVQAAEKEGLQIQEFVDKNSQLFFDVARKLNVNFDIFQKGSNKKHYESSQKLWTLCFKNGDIYNKEYSGLYCVGCELFYEKDELDENGQCFEHPGKKLEKVTEENYFFKFSKYQTQIEKLLETDEIKIIPQNRKKEALAFIRQGLKDISISRSNKRAKNWGVPVPDDPNQRMYVWFDALNIYQSGIGFGADEEKYNKWWPADLHVIGKGILRFHAIYWPAFLLSAGLKLPKSIFVHGYFTVNGQKMSKTIGNVVDPVEIIKKYGTDVLRYYLLREIPSTADGDFSEKRLRELYNADLANGLGNLVSRVAKLCETSGFSYHVIPARRFEEASPLGGKAGIQKTWIPDQVGDDKKGDSETKSGISKQVKDALDQYRFDEALKKIWENVTKANQMINETKPWELKGDELKNNLNNLVSIIYGIAFDLRPILPETSEKIEEQFKGPKIASKSPLFPRI